MSHTSDTIIYSDIRNSDLQQITFRVEFLRYFRIIRTLYFVFCSSPRNLIKYQCLRDYLILVRVWHKILLSNNTYILSFEYNRRSKASSCLEEEYGANRTEEREGKASRERIEAAIVSRRVIDNDNFVSACPRTVLTSGLLPSLAPRVGEVRTNGKGAQRADRVSLKGIVGTMRRHREPRRRHVPPVDSSFLPN